MSHHISAIITNNNVDRDIITQYDLSVFAEGSFSIIALNSYHSDYWTDKLNINSTISNNDIILDNSTTHYFCSVLKLVNYAIVETDYFGGIGGQKANLYNYNKLILSSVSINIALKKLGVIASKDVDEFDALNLSKYRCFDDYYVKYYDY